MLHNVRTEKAMRSKQCYWTRKLELDLINFVQQRDFIWKQSGNTNHHIQQKYKAYAEFAAAVGYGFTARSIRDRWVNIRSTFNHNLNRVNKSRLKAKSTADVYVPCWPLWKPLQFLRAASKTREKSTGFQDDEFLAQLKIFSKTLQGDAEGSQYVKEEIQSDTDIANDQSLVEIRQRGQRTNRPRHKSNITFVPVGHKKNNKCKRLLDDLLESMKPLTETPQPVDADQSYWFFGKHVAERLNCMRKDNAASATRDILCMLEEWPE